MKRLAVLFGLALLVQNAACVMDSAPAGEVQAEDLTGATDTKIKNKIVKAATNLSFLSESDHPLVWVRSSTVAPGPANAWFIHKSFSSVTDGDAMADKPLSKMKSETVDFESFASRFVPVMGEDADNFVYHQQITAVLDLVRANIKDPKVIRLGRQSGNGLIGAISVYIVGTLPSGKVGGLFTVSVET